MPTFRNDADHMVPLRIHERRVEVQEGATVEVPATIIKQDGQTRARLRMHFSEVKKARKAKAKPKETADG